MNIMKRALAVVAGVLLIVGAIQAQSFPTETFRKSVKDTTVVKASLTIIYRIIVENVGSADTLSIWDASAVSGMTEAKRILRLPAWAIGSYGFGTNGLWLRTGLTVSISGTTAGRYTIIYE